MAKDCTEEVIDAILERMEVAIQKVDECQGAIVKLKKAEVDLLKCFEEARDFMLQMLKNESRETLQNMFGGDCKRIASINGCLERAQFGDKGNQNDQRTDGCKKACESVEQILEDLGLGWKLRQALEEARVRQRSKSEFKPEGIAAELQQAVIESAVVEPIIIEEPSPKREPPSKKDMASEALNKTLDENLIDRILACTEIAELAELGELDKSESLGNWMIWMVHRAYLNDPTLDKFDFSNLTMPPGKDEPRIAPKLMKAVATNTHIEKLLLPNTNLNSRQAAILAESLTQNSKIRVLNVDSNSITDNTMESLIDSFGTNQTLEEVRIQNQRGFKLGNAHYEALKRAVEANKFIYKLGCPLENPHFREPINRSLMRNSDNARQRRNAAKEAAGGYS